MSVAATLLAVGVSLGAVAALCVTDAKRRRAFRLPPVDRRWSGLLWTLVFLPGVVLPFASGAAGFVAWTGAVPLVGWIIAALPPGRITDWGRRARAALPGQRLGATVADWARAGIARLRARPGARPADDVLESRIRALETEVAALRLLLLAPEVETEGGARVVELSGRR